MEKQYYIRARVIGENLMGQKLIQLQADGADGIRFFTDDKSLLTVGDLAASRPPARWEWGEVCGQSGIYCTNCRAGWVDSVHAGMLAASHKFCPSCGALMDPYPPK